MSLNAGFLSRASHSCTASLQPASASVRTGAFYFILIFLDNAEGSSFYFGLKIESQQKLP